MSKTSGLFAALLACAVLGGSVLAQDAAKEKKAGAKKERKFSAKCVISGKAAKKDQAVKYMEGEVYVCCGNCKAKLEKAVKDKSVDAKMATKANAQLVQTGQYRQTKCPFSGGKVDKTKTVKVGPRKVAFCCDKCVAKVNGEKDKDKQMAMVFSVDAFKKGFAKKTAKKGKGKAKKKKTDA